MASVPGRGRRRRFGLGRRGLAITAVATVTFSVALAVALVLGAIVQSGTAGASLAPTAPSASRDRSGSPPPAPVDRPVDPGASPSASPSESASPARSPNPRPTPVPRPPTPLPSPTPLVVPAPLTGRLVSPEAAQRHVIAVMVDDLAPARPQAGFNAASIVWHAPAEGGVPRYMLLFQESVPGLVGPVRSARPYYIAWAAEWRSTYVHSGGSPRALRTLRRLGRGQLVYDADEYRWGGGRYLWRSRDRFAPHNIYTDGERLRRLAERLGAEDGPIEGAWRFAPDLPLELRPQGGRIMVPYRYDDVRFDYDRATNRYVRSVTGASPQEDAADGAVVAPANVVVLFVEFSPANDRQPWKLRLDAEVVGRGRALVARNGRTIEATWRKDGRTEPTLLFDGEDRPITLTVGQTFVQVVDRGTDVRVVDGQAPPPPRPGPRPR